MIINYQKYYLTNLECFPMIKVDRYQILIVLKSVPFHLIANFYPAGDQTRSPGRNTQSAK